MREPLAAMLPRQNEALPPSFVFAFQRQQSAPILGDCKGSVYILAHKPYLTRWF